MSNLTDFLFPKATQAQAEAGSSNSVLMTALRTKQYVDGQKGAVNGVASLGPTGRLIVSQINGLGADQTWQDVTSSRDFDVSYLNDTGKPIVVSCSASSTSSSSYRTLMIQVSTDNMSWVQVDRRTADGVKRTTSTAVIPAGFFYQFTVSGSIANVYFAELR